MGLLVSVENIQLFAMDNFSRANTHLITAACRQFRRLVGMTLRGWTPVWPRRKVILYELITAGLYIFDRAHQFVRIVLKKPTLVRPKDNDRYISPRQILLVGEILIGSQEHVELLCFRRFQQVSILKP